ncbi:MAG TPA: hypothetical protein DET40_19035 [Lentisphaeria bacterium]|nr:MAG: hypothetical protein A2X45_25330 [Lentisphaerae bacterium GWF2_50_93]HCE45642.1 hypothetical protein [Lentisphaeria bacterium]
MKFVDLTLPMKKGMPFYPSGLHTPFSAEKTAEIGANGREIRRIEMGSHCGTHIDGMTHFLKNGWSVDKIPLSILVGPAYLVNLGKLPQDSVITRKDVSDRLPKGRKIERLLLRADWSRFWEKKQYFNGWPHLSEDCCSFIAEKGIKLAGFDFPSPDETFTGKNLDSPNHKFFLKKKIVLIEYLTNLGKLKPGNIFLIALPLRIAGGDGSPSRVVAYNI